MINDWKYFPMDLRYGLEAQKTSFPTFLMCFILYIFLLETFWGDSLYKPTL